MFPLIAWANGVSHGLMPTELHYEPCCGNACGHSKGKSIIIVKHPINDGLWCSTLKNSTFWVRGERAHTQTYIQDTN